MIDSPPGSFRLSDGTYCEPGYVEHRFKPGLCVPPGYSSCENGLICPPGTTCNSNGTCEGSQADGPQCGNTRCAAGRLCSTTGRCYNPVVLQDCGNGDFCTKAATCTAPRGCAYISTQRSPQIKR